MNRIPNWPGFPLTRAYGLEAEPESAAGAFPIFFQRPGGRHTAAALETRHHDLRRFHALGHLILRQASAGAGFDQSCRERELLFERVILAPIVGVLYPFLLQIIHGFQDLHAMFAEAVSWKVVRQAVRRPFA